MNLLIVSYVYAPDRSPRAYRWTALAEYWARQGHRVDIVSAWKQGDDRLERRGGVTIHRVGGGIVERLRALLGEASHRAGDAPKTRAARSSALLRAAKGIYAATLKQLFWPDYAFHWYPSAAAQGRALCRATAYDAVISVSHPFTSHLVGLALKRRTPTLRWLVDIGDPFSLLDEIPPNNTALYRHLNRRAEAAVLRESDAIAVTVERCRADLVDAFAASAEKIAVVPPLLSLPAVAGPIAPLFAPDATHLVFIGTLYRALRDPSPLLALFRALHRRRGDLHLHFFGALNDCAPCFAALDDMAARNIHRHGVVPRETIAAAMLDADILVNIGNATSHQLPSKLVEYAAAARPILNLASKADDTAAEFLAGYPASLTLTTRGGRPDQPTIDAALAFIAAPPSVTAEEAGRFLMPYTLERIAAAYAALLAPRATAATMAGRRYRILINAIHARAGGGLTYLRNLLPLLADQPDLELHLIAHPDRKVALAALSSAIRTHDVPMPRSWLALLLWEQLVLPVVAWRIGYDAVLSPANFGPLLLPAQIVVVQNAVTVGGHEKRLGKKIYWAALRLMTMLSLCVARRAIAVSRYVADSVAPPFRRGAPCVIHHGVDAVFSSAPAAASADDFLLAVGDLYVQKNLHRLIDALVIVRRRHPAMALRIAGAAIDADLAASLHRRVAALRLEKAVVFVGRRSVAELVALYRTCAVFVFPSSIESFGMPLIEAMACGAPVVAASTSAIPEIAGGAALLCDPQEPRDIAEKILRVLDDPTLRQQLRERGLARAKAFSWTDCAQRTAALLREAAAGRSGRAVVAPSPSP
jgi:glycosyltransferase involved in cell wall biosynthesis